MPLSFLSWQSQSNITNDRVALILRGLVLPQYVLLNQSAERLHLSSLAQTRRTRAEYLGKAGKQAGNLPSLRLFRISRQSSEFALDLRCHRSHRAPGQSVWHCMSSQVVLGSTRPFTETAGIT